MTDSTERTLTALEIADAIKSWVMVILTLGFVILYALALTGKLKPLADVSIVTRLEPIIFVIVGYYFGRLPAQQNEKTLQAEISRQTQKADASQHAKEQMMQARETAEEKLKSINAALTSIAPNVSISTLTENLAKGNGAGPDSIRHSIVAALNILKS